MNNNTKPLRILLVDDHILFREGLTSMLENHDDLQVVGQAGTVQKAVEKALQLQPDLILLDINLPDGEGTDAARMILAQLPETKIVMLTIYESDELLFSALRAGAKGYILKNTPLNNLLASLRAIGRGEAAISRTQTLRVIDEFSRLGAVQNPEDDLLDRLTARELEVLQELGTGASNHDIAERLVISENTVKIHVHKILDKLKLRNRHQAARFARRLGLSAAAGSNGEEQ